MNNHISTFSLDEPRPKQDVDNPQYVWKSSGPIGIMIAWEPLLAIAATKLAEALGTKLGEGSGEALLDSLLGRKAGDKDFEREVIGRLTRIEQKLDSLIVFLRDSFPELFRDELITTERNDLDASLAELKASIGSPSTDRLLSAVAKVGMAGLKLLMRGQGCYLSGVRAMAGMLSGYSRLAASDKGHLKALIRLKNPHFPTKIRPFLPK
jgi:hypothetical protein